ncbi:MAG: prephenate dehydrogenase/arogenate dehydrogenase family protein [Thermoflexales bacterium]|nr:prephenate dehydrogenase/arogenate dehydrogenase family protein [Thermoflexales bacterium]
MANNQISLIGLGPVAASMGLALKSAKPDLLLVGTDRDRALAANMLKLGAVDRLERTPPAACREAGLVIVAEPLDDMAAIFQDIAGSLLPGSVVTDIAPLKADVMRWAEQHLPEHVCFVGGHPLIMAKVNEPPNPKLFSGVHYSLVTDSSTETQGVEVVTGLVELLGAQPYFLGAAEHDGLMAAVEELPQLLQLALLAVVSEAGSWRDNRRAASRPFINATANLGDDAALLVYTHRLNRSSLAQWVDLYQAALERLKMALKADDETAFQETVGELYETYHKWLHERQPGVWDSSPPPVKVDRGNLLSQLLWPGRASRR